MKLKNVFVVLLVGFVSRQAMAIGVKILMKGRFIDHYRIRPLYTGALDKGYLLGEDQPRDPVLKFARKGYYFKTGLHQFRGLIVEWEGKTYRFDFSKLGLRGTGEVTIGIAVVAKNNYDHTRVAEANLSGYTDMLFKKATDVNARITVEASESIGKGWVEL